MKRELFAANVAKDMENNADARAAALYVHAMPQDDQAWLLSQLPPLQRATLQALLDELRALGIPADAGLLGSVAALPSDSSPAPSDRTERPSLEEAWLRNASPDELAPILTKEPLELVARLLAMRDWPWEPAVLERLTDVQRHDLQIRRSRWVRTRTDASVPAASEVSGRSFEHALISLLHARWQDLARHPAGQGGPLGDKSPSKSAPAQTRLTAFSGWWRRLKGSRRPGVAIAEGRR